MWILSFLPDWIFYAILFVGILGLLATFVLNFIPFVSNFTLPIQVVSIVLVLVGSFMSGAITDNDAWKMKVEETKVKNAEIVAKSSEENVKIITKYVDRIKVVKEHGADVIKYINQDLVKYDNKCAIPVEFVKAINDASEATK